MAHALAILVYSIGYSCIYCSFLHVFGNVEKKERYNRLYKTASSNLKKSKDEILYVTSMCSSKEEEIVKLKETIATSKKQIQEKDGMIRTLNRKNSVQETSLNERNKQYRICESEKSELLSKLQAKEENIGKLKGVITLANEKTQKIGKEKKQLESSKALLDKEIDELKATIKQQANAYRNLNLKVGRRDEKIEKMSEALAEVQKELQTVQDEKCQVEKMLQEIQETLKEKEQNKYMDKNENLVERIARW